MNLKSLGIFSLFVVLVVFMSFMTANPWYDIGSSTFWKPNNVENLLRRTSMYGLLGIGVAFVIITSGIDLSIGSIVCLCGCLLALFLQVDYLGIDDRQVIRVDSVANTILLRSDDTGWASVGDKVRLSETRRADPAILTVTKIESVKLQNGSGASAGTAILMTVDGKLTRDDDRGIVSQLFAIHHFDEATAEKPTRIEISAMKQALAPRDRVSLVHSSLGQKQSEITSVVSQQPSTILELQRSLGSDFSNDWYAVPLRRVQRMSVPIAIVSVLGIAAMLGAIHGLLITRVPLQPFVVTLCGLLIYRGISRWLVHDQPVGFGNEYTDSLSWLGSGKWTLWSWDALSGTGSFGLPYPLFIMVGVAIAASIFLNKTVWGRYLLALGRNEEAARFSGIHTQRYILWAYMLCTLAAGLGGILFALDGKSVSPSSFGNFFELYAIAAAVLGGCSLRGGEGTILGVVIGTAVMQVLNNLILLMKISNELEFAIIGFVILFGVAADEVVRRFASRRHRSLSKPSA